MQHNCLKKMYARVRTDPVRNCEVNAHLNAHLNLQNSCRHNTHQKRETHSQLKWSVRTLPQETPSGFDFNPTHLRAAVSNRNRQVMELVRKRQRQVWFIPTSKDYNTKPSPNRPGSQVLLLRAVPWTGSAKPANDQ